MLIDAYSLSWIPAPCPTDISFSILSANVAWASEPPSTPSSLFPTEVSQEPSPLSEEGDTSEFCKYGYIVIEAPTQVEVFDSANEASRYVRPLELAVFGVLSYLTGHHFSVYEVLGTWRTKAPFVPTEQAYPVAPGNPRLIWGGEDLSGDLAKILAVSSESTDGERRFLFSLLDRWRRAQYLLCQSEAGLHHEEAFLGFFHILELLATKFDAAQKNEAQERLKEFVADLLEKTFKLRGPKLQSEVQTKAKSLSNIFLAPDFFSISSKILYFLDHFGLLNTRTHALVGDVVKTRNEIAHGRTTFRQGMVWPVPPFFPILPQNSQLTEILQVLTARAIGAYYELDAWNNPWDSVLDGLDPPLDVIKSFVSRFNEMGLSNSDFAEGTHESVTPASVLNTYLKGKITFEQLENTLGDYVLRQNDVRSFSSTTALAMVLLADSANEELAGHCRQNVPKIPPDQFEVTNIKDVLRVLEDLGVKPVWFRSRLTPS